VDHPGDRHAVRAEPLSVAFGVGFRVAPGVRLRASRRGPRMSLGPRMARVHVGSGRAAVSSGSGPVTLWSTLSGGGHTSASGGGAGSASARKADEWATIRAHLDELLSQHRVPVERATRPVVPPPPRRSRWAVRVARFRELAGHLDGVAEGGAGEVSDGARRGSVGLAGRWRAWRASGDGLDAEVAVRGASAEAERVRRQQAADAWWERLLANEPAVVAERLEAALVDHAMPATVTAVEEGRASLALAVEPPEKLMGTREPTVTEAGNLSLRRMTQTRRHELYQAAISSAVLAVAAEAFAVAPGLAAMEVAVVEPQHLGGPGVLLLADLPRETVLPDGADRPVVSSLWEVAEAGRATVVMDRGGRIGALRPLEPAEVPEVAMLLDVLDVE
jgi:hypothetical protein